MNARSDVSVCANPNCDSKFVRFGDGELFVFPISDPDEWGLPADAKQKVLWLCGKCSIKMQIRVDRRRHTAQVVNRPVFTQRAS